MGDDGTGASEVAPSVGSEAQVSLDQPHVYKLSPQEARNPLSSLLHSASLETIHGGAGGEVIVDPRNPGMLRFVRDEDANPEGPPITGDTAP